MACTLKRGNYRGNVSNAKPIYLITLIEIFPALKENLIKIDNPVLNECFRTNVKIFQSEKRTPLFMPYFHLCAEPFYEIIWKDGHAPVANAHSPSAKFLKEHTLGARLDDALWDLLQEPANREYLRGCIIKQYLTD